MNLEKSKAGLHLQKLYDDINKEDMDFRDFNISKVYAKKLIEENEIQNRDFTYKVEKEIPKDKTKRSTLYNNISNYEEEEAVLYEKI